MFIAPQFPSSLLPSLFSHFLPNPQYSRTNVLHQCSANTGGQGTVDFITLERRSKGRRGIRRGAVFSAASASCPLPQLLTALLLHAYKACQPWSEMGDGAARQVAPRPPSVAANERARRPPPPTPNGPREDACLGHLKLVLLER